MKLWTQSLEKSSSHQEYTKMANQSNLHRDFPTRVRNFNSFSAHYTSTLGSYESEDRRRDERKRGEGRGKRKGDIRNIELTGECMDGWKYGAVFSRSGAKKEHSSVMNSCLNLHVHGPFRTMIMCRSLSSTWFCLLGYTHQVSEGDWRNIVLHWTSFCT